MKTIIKDSMGEKLKTREGDSPLKVKEVVEWNGKRVKVKDVYYDATIDARIVILDGDLKPI